MTRQGGMIIDEASYDEVWTRLLGTRMRRTVEVGLLESYFRGRISKTQCLIC